MNTTTTKPTEFDWDVFDKYVDSFVELEDSNTKWTWDDLMNCQPLTDYPPRHPPRLQYTWNIRRRRHKSRSGKTSHCTEQSPSVCAMVYIRFANDIFCKGICNIVQKSTNNYELVLLEKK